MPPSYSVMGVGHTQLAENEIRKLQQEFLDSIVDGFGSNVQTVTIDEYAIRQFRHPGGQGSC